MDLKSLELWIFYIVFTLVIVPEAYGLDLEDLVSQQFEHSRMKTESAQELWYTNSKRFPRQIAVLNSSAQVGVVLDANGEKVAILNGETGTGVVIDKVLRMGAVVNKGGWQLVKQDLKSYLADVNVSNLMDLNYENTFNVDDSEGTNLGGMAIKEVKCCIGAFGERLISFLAETPGKFLVLVMNLFGSITHCLKNVLGPVLNIVANGWARIKCGIMAFMNVFLWLGKLIAGVAGGTIALISKVVAFPFVAILTAVDGVRAFYRVLMELASKFDLMKILGTVLSIPSKITSFIAGLGGALEIGVTGVFNILSSLFNFTTMNISTAIEHFTKTLLGFFGTERPKSIEINYCISELLTISDQQEKTHKNDFQEFKNFLSSVAGLGEYSVGGVAVGNVVKLLTEEKNPGSHQVVGVLDALKPLLPFNRAVPHLFIGMVRMLDTTNGASRIENIMPSVKIPAKALENVNNNLLGAALRSANAVEHSLKDLRTLPAPEVLRRLPVVSSIYEELDKAVQRYDNCTLADLLINHSIAHELVEITTRALELPVS